MPFRLLSLTLTSVVILVACAGSENQPTVLRLVDLFPSASVIGTGGTGGTGAAGAPPEPTEWRFEEGHDVGWKAGAGVSGLRVDGNVLAGRSITNVPIVHVERHSGLDDPDVLHQVIVRARVSEGANLTVTFSRSESLNLERTAATADEFPWPLSTPLIPGDDLQTYSINAGSAARASFQASGIRHILLRPTDVEGATFEIESLRLVFRKEHLAGIPAGVSWQGLSEVYRETVVARSPEEARFNLSLPSRPMLDLAVGTVEDGPVTFRVTLDDDVLLEHTVSMPHRWEPVPIDLDAFAGADVELTLSLESDKPGAIGFWGTPTVRSRGRYDPGAPRGVVMILLDTLRRDHLDAYGYQRSTAPTVSRIAEEGTLFSDAIAQGAWTKVSVPSMLSSTYPSSNGIFELNHKLPASADTMAEAFREAGYATWAGSASGFSGKGTNLHQGVEVLHESGSIRKPDRANSAKSARVIVDRLLPWLDAHHDVPFFVFFHALDPHSPYEPYRPYDTLWGAPDGKEAHEARVDKVRPFIKSGFMKPMGLPLVGELEEAGVDPEEFVRHELDWYDGSIRAADVEIRRILEKLENLGIADETLIVFSSDHGEEFLDHGGHFHEENVYGEMINVPLILRWPGVVPEGHVIDETVQMLDVAPTVLELAKIAKPDSMQGESLVPLFTTPERWSARPAVSEWTRRTDQRDEEMVDAFSIIVDGYKLIHNVERPDGFPEYELYDHRQDPLDQNDIASENPEIVERLSKQLDDWHAWALANKLPTDAEASEGIDAAELERLRSLGYVQ